MRQVLATGYNGLPRGFEDHVERLQRPVKYDLIVHAEMNAIIQCARNGVSPVGATLYSSFSPCIHCSLAIVQAGITKIVTKHMHEGDEHWNDSIDKSLALFEEVGVDIHNARWYPSMRYIFAILLLLVGCTSKRVPSRPHVYT